MTIERTRQILGDDIANLSDCEVEDLLHDVGSFCSVLLDLSINDIVSSQPSKSLLLYEKDSGHLRSSQ